MLIALLLIGGGTYIYTQKKEINLPAVWSPVTQYVPTGTSTTRANVTESTISAKVVPEITSVSPSSGPTGTVMTLHGSFPTGTEINFGGEVVGQTNIDMNSFTFIIPSSFAVHGLGTPSVPVAPENYTISLTNGNSVKFKVTPTPALVANISTPTITSISPSEITVGAEVTIHGSNFSPTTMIAMIGLGVVTSIAPSRVSPDGATMTFTVPTALLNQGTYSVQVYTPGMPKGTAYSTLIVKFANPYRPIITSITPESVMVGDTVTISGSNFYGDPRVYVDMYMPGVIIGVGPITPSSYTRTSLSFVVPPNISIGEHSVAIAGSGWSTNWIALTVYKANPGGGGR